MDIRAADDGRSVPGMTPAHCGHLEVQIGQCNYESQFLQQDILHHICKKILEYIIK